MNNEIVITLATKPGPQVNAVLTEGQMQYIIDLLRGWGVSSLPDTSLGALLRSPTTPITHTYTPTKSGM